jgi:AMMECR1 domain-containing protein
LSLLGGRDAGLGGLISLLLDTCDEFWDPSGVEYWCYPNKSLGEIDISQHGVVVRSGGRSGVFLPQVAEETGRSRDELLSHLCRDKAGLPADPWKHGAALYVFTIQAFTSPAPGASSHAGSSPGT